MKTPKGSPSFQIGPSISANRHQFLKDSLKDLQDALASMGQHIIICQQPVQSLSEIIENYGISHVFRSRGQHFLDSDSWSYLKNKYTNVEFSEIGANRLFNTNSFPLNCMIYPAVFLNLGVKLRNLKSCRQNQR